MGKMEYLFFQSFGNYVNLNLFYLVKIKYFNTVILKFKTK